MLAVGRAVGGGVGGVGGVGKGHLAPAGRDGVGVGVGAAVLAAVCVCVCVSVSVCVRVRVAAGGVLVGTRSVCLLRC